jgi:uncharacterized damage-inducible protein DinB
MELRLRFERFLVHDRWANQRALASLEAMADPPAQALELLSHLMGAEVSWVTRMTEGKDPADWEAWETSDRAFIRKAWEETVPAKWEAFLADAVLSAPDREFTYVNFLGETHSTRVEDALIQLMLHSSYHRGQIASRVRAAGGTPAVVDWIRAVREGALT